MKESYIRLEHAVPEHSRWFCVNWCLGNTCNYSCSYCPKVLHDGSQRWPSLSVIKAFITRLMRQHWSKRFYFEFTGGEVTLYKDFVPLMQFIKDEMGANVGLISNGSRTIRFWEENKHLFDHICLSFHPEEADPDHYLEVVRTLHKSTGVHCNMMMSPEKFDQCFALAERVAELGDCTLALQPLIVNLEDTLYDYTPEQTIRMHDGQIELTNRIKLSRPAQRYRGDMRKVWPNGDTEEKPAQSFIGDKLNNWKGWECYAGLEQLVVDMDGSVHRGWCKVGQPIGHISDENLPLYTDPVTCTKTMCHCNYDIMCTKVNSNES